MAEFPDLSPEMRLLAACTLWVPESRDAPRVPADLNWDLFYALVERHRVAPSVHRCLAAAMPSVVPAAEYARLARRARLASIRAMHHAASTLEVARALGRERIEVLALKGVLLSRRIYRDPGLREVRDIDLLIPPSGVVAADQLLREDGWQRTFPVNEPTPRRLAALLAREHHFEYFRPAHGVTLELHWQLEGWDRERVSWLWRHSSPGRWGEVTMRELDDTALLLLLVDHGGLHQWFCLKWLADVAVLAGQIDAATIENILLEAEALQLRSSLAQAGLLVQQVYGVRLPPRWARLAKSEPGAPRLAADALRCLLGSEDAYFRGQAGWAWLARKRYLRRLHGSAVLSLFPGLLRPADFDEVPLPDWLFWLYYPLRPLLWLRRASAGSGGDRLRQTRAAVPR